MVYYSAVNQTVNQGILTQPHLDGHDDESKFIINNINIDFDPWMAGGEIVSTFFGHIRPSNC